MPTAKPRKRFATMAQVDVPQGRNGKHKGIVSSVLAELAELKDGEALKIVLAELGDSKENIRSALNRAAKQAAIALATSSNDDYLYVWKTDSEGGAE